MKKKYTLIIISLLSILTISLVGCSSAAEPLNKTPELIDGLNAFSVMEELVIKFPNRTSGYSENVNGITVNYADETAKWIAGKFTEMGYAGEDSEDGIGLQKFAYNNPFANTRRENAYNVVFRKDNPDTNKQVIIGAHYDNVTSITVNKETIGGEGVYNNATGIAALLETARVLASESFPFDLVFVAFGAEELGLLGSKNFVENMSAEEIDNTLLMVNYDKVAGGDYLYMYSEEFETEHNRYFYNISANKDLYISDLPSYLRPSLYTAMEDSLLMYYHEAMQGDNTTFNSKGINTLSFISCNFKDKSTPALVEMKGKVNIAYTSRDNLTEIIARYGGRESAVTGINKSIHSAVSCVVYGLKDQTFASVMESSDSAKKDYSFITNFNYISYISYGVLGAALIALIVIYFAMRTKVKQHNVMILTKFGKVDLSKGVIILDENNIPKADIDPFGDEYGKKEGSSVKEEDNDFAGEANKKDADEDDIFGNY